MDQSALHTDRLNYTPRLPSPLTRLRGLQANPSPVESPTDPALRKRFPNTLDLKGVSFSEGDPATHQSLRVGVVLSGGQAPGGHNVIAGLFDAMQEFSSESTLIGFLGGPSGIVNNEHVILTAEGIAPYRNQGGFDIIGSGRTKIESPEQFAATAETVKALNLDALVVIGGDDSNTNAALLAEYFRDQGSSLVVVGVPKTIDGDLKNDQVEVSFGFDTAVKVYAEMIGNILRDALSARKYYFFIKLMGRSASHITLEWRAADTSESDPHQRGDCSEGTLVTAGDSTNRGPCRSAGTKR